MSIKYSKAVIDDKLQIKSYWSKKDKNKHIHQIFKQWNAKLRILKDSSKIQQAEYYLELCSQAMLIYKIKAKPRKLKRTVKPKPSVKIVYNKNLDKKKNINKSPLEDWAEHTSKKIKKNKAPDRIKPEKSNIQKIEKNYGILDSFGQVFANIIIFIACFIVFNLIIVIPIANSFTDESTVISKDEIVLSKNYENQVETKKILLKKEKEGLDRKEQAISDKLDKEIKSWQDRDRKEEAKKNKLEKERLNRKEQAISTKLEKERLALVALFEKELSLKKEQSAKIKAEAEKRVDDFLGGKNCKPDPYRFISYDDFPKLVESRSNFQPQIVELIDLDNHSSYWNVFLESNELSRTKFKRHKSKAVIELSCFVNNEGNVSSVIFRSNSKKGAAKNKISDIEFNDAARDFVKQLSFEPGIKNREPICMWINLKVVISKRK